MSKLFFSFFSGIFIFLPTAIFASSASDFIVNNQSTYAIPRATTRVLILDLTLPSPRRGETLQLKSIKLHNIGTAIHTDILKMMFWQDGLSPGWDNDEIEAANILYPPFWDAHISGNFSEYRESSQQRIFITLDISSTAISKRTINPQLVAGAGDEAAVQFVSNSEAAGPVDIDITGFERTIIRDASIPCQPVSPLALASEAISTSIIRWSFLDLSNNEFGFKILDSDLKIVVKSETENLSYIDETNLEPNTEYSGRRVVAFNDRGESLSSSLAMFPAVSTLPMEPAEEEVIEEVEAVEEEIEEEEVVEEASPSPEATEGKAISEMTTEELKTKITEIQQSIIKLLSQLIQVIQSEIVAAAAWVCGIFSRLIY
jgi:hypothetical protein